ncbi:unnamed protein product [Dracunculus medinensis]|uniref:Uncharacterized protein n=1 Tax=Dracunculus medinensis TaxID=318479 RepID=A0A0N4UMC5_DRAME|nr:unnamed protein product [Dracunculus medinensis]
MRNYFLKQAPYRRKILHSKDKVIPIQNILVPEVFCSILVKFGQISAGHWICNPYSLPYECLIASIRLENRPDFNFYREIEEWYYNAATILKTKENIYDANYHEIIEFLGLLRLKLVVRVEEKICTTKTIVKDKDLSKPKINESFKCFTASFVKI